jgi:hypothetical protein
MGHLLKDSMVDVGDPEINAKNIPKNDGKTINPFPIRMRQKTSMNWQAAYFIGRSSFWL